MNSELLISIVNQVIYVPIRHHYKCRAIITYVESALQISSFLTNKANFGKAQMNVSPVITREYKNISNWTLGENEPNSKPIKPNFRKARMNLNFYSTKDYENVPLCRRGENKPDSKPNKANLSRRSLWRSRIKANFK
jgi:hypothetical protein